jgi:DNA (cytosine-5)-methyltransferase 1
MKLRLLDLFSGIGGFSLGLERSGNFETAAFCEIEPYCRAVLKKHWPNVTVYEDVKELSKERLAADGLAINAICGGFPCQDISTAGRGAGLAGERSGLWFEFHRLIKEIKPQVAIIENVSALRSRGLDEVLRSLAEIGYDAEWHCIPASAVGAHHQRDRIWIMAYPNSAQCQGDGLSSGIHPKYFGAWYGNLEASSLADTNNQLWRSQSPISSGERTGSRDQLGWSSSAVANATELHSNGRNTDSEVGVTSTCESGNSSGTNNLADPTSLGPQGQGMYGRPINPETDQDRKANWSINRGKGTSRVWDTEPDVGRVAHGVPNRVDRLRALGNAVVPQIPEMIGREIA